MPSFSMPFKLPEIKLPEKLVGHGPWIQWMMGENLPRNLLNGQKPTKKKTWNPEIRKFKWILLKFRWFI